MKAFLLPLIFFGLVITVVPVHAQSAADQYQKGLAFLNKDEIPKAFDSFSAAVTMAEKERNWPLYFRSLSRCGEAGYAYGGTYEQKALALLRGGLKHTNKQTLDSLGNFYYHLGNIYREITVETDSALQFLDNAQRILVKVHGENVEKVALCYSRKGYIYRYLRFDLHEAQVNFEKSLSIMEKLPGNYDRQLAEDYYNLAVTYRAQGEFEKSISYATQALKLIQKLKAVEFEGICHSLFGTIYMDMDSLVLAEREIKKAIEINLKSGRSRGVLVRYYISLGLIADRLGQQDRTKEYYERSIAIGQKDDIDQYGKFGVVNAWVLLADLLQKNNAYAAAYAALKSAQHQLELLVGKQRAEDAMVMFSFSDYFFRTNQLDSALYYNQKALTAGISGFHAKDDLVNPSLASLKDEYYTSTSSVKNNMYLPDVVFRKAEILRSLYQSNHQSKYLQASLECFALTEELLARSRKAFDFEQAKWRTSAAYFSVYETPIEALMEVYSKDKRDSVAALLFLYMEKSKSKTLRDALAVAESYKKSNLPDSIVTSLQVLRDRQRRIQNEIDQLNSDKHADKISTLRLSIAETDRKLKQIQEYVRTAYPDYYRLKYSYAVASLADVQQHAAKKGITLLEYFYGKDHVYGVAITGSSIEIKKLGRSDSIRAMITIFSDHFNVEKRNEVTRAERYQNFGRNSSALYQTLVAPFGSLPSGKVVIVPDGLLNAIPFESLLTSKPTNSAMNYKALPYWIKSTEISYAFFATSLFRESPKRVGSKLLGFAYSDDDRRVERTTNAILGTAVELDAIKNFFSAGIFLRDTSATEGAFKAMASEFDLLHLALHGQGDDDNANLSYLLFRNSARDSLNDGKLHAYELYGLNLQASLAVLSACETGLGKTIKGEGTFSIANAFAYSGCPNVLMSLWKVNDQTTAKIIGSFYENFADGNSIDEALAKAKRTYLDDADELTADPAFWASFVAVGDMQYKMKTPLSVGQTLLILLGGVSVFLIFVFVRKKKLM